MNESDIENLKIALGKGIRAYRKANKMTQEDVAQVLQCSISAISTYETGKKMPPPDKLKALADYYGINIDDFLDPRKYTDDEKRRIRLFRKMIDESKVSEKSKYFDTIMQLVDLTEEK